VLKANLALLKSHGVIKNLSDLPPIPFDKYYFRSMKRILFFYLLFISLTSYGQLHFNAIQGSVASGLAGSGTLLEGVDGLFNNQAGIAENEKISFIVSSELRYLTPDLTSFGAGISIPTNGKGVFGLSVSNLGLEDYKEQKIGLAYARKLTEGMNLGVQLDWLNTNIVNFGSNSLFTAELGFMADIGKKFTIGSHIFSPVKVSLTEQDNDVNTRIRFGASYAPGDKLRVLFEVDKWQQNPLTVRGGFEYLLQENIKLRFGASSNPALYSLGLSYHLSESLHFDGSYSIHSILGSSPSLTIKGNR